MYSWVTPQARWPIFIRLAKGENPFSPLLLSGIMKQGKERRLPEILR